MDQNKINDIIHAGKIKPYIDSSIRLASRSKQSHFYRQYRRFSATSVEFKPEHMKPPANTFILVLEGNVDNVINHLPEFEREVFLLWALDGFRYETLSKATGIPIWYLYRAVQRAKKLIKQNIPHDLHITRRKGSTS
jgi:DNA-directed RNA polymerase specialized sigma24 family protein